ncbi:MAG: hypothetical protein Q9163_001757 [Psora crenata]
MTDYGVHPDRRMPPNNYGHASSYQRDAAFSNIFGAAPPPGRSQTMTSQATQQPQERTNTMSSQISMGSQLSPAAAAHRPTPQQRQQPNGYPSPTTNGYYPPQRQSSGLVQPQPQPQYLPQPINPSSRPYPQPQRIDSRQPTPSQYSQYNRPPPNRGYPPNLVDSYKPLPNRGYPSNSALNSDPYRSQSMANMRGPSYNAPPNTNYQPSSNYSQAAANSFRQQPYHTVGARTTAQGRIVPERHDERAMSMNSFSMATDHSQTMSGRVIPNRRRESEAETLADDVTLREAPSRTSTMTGPDARTQSMNMDSASLRTMSMASTIVSPSERSDSLSHKPPGQKNTSSTSSAVISAQSRAPLVYPALLSRVADVFRERISAGDRNKNELSYKFAFTGAEAVDLISYIIKTTDRNLALLLGRSLDAQKFFHDVTYDHRLRDSSTEIYQFREQLMEDTSTHVNGVFTLLTECYSPTCTKDKLCYSIACPRRLEQQARLNMKPQPGLKRQQSSASMHADETDEQKLWINTVSQEVADSVPEKEKKRQEIISEIMYTERDFVKDLEYLRDFWMRPLRSNNPANPSPIPERHRERFVRTVFSNCMEVHAVNSKMAEALTRRQQENPVVRNVGDIFLEWVPRFEPFIKYGANQLWGKYEFERERASNPLFQRFVDETERLKESRKLELNGYLTKPTTRLARYPLLLENVVKNTVEDNPDTKDIPRAIAMIKEILAKVNAESGKAENQFNLRMLQQQLIWGPGQKSDLKLLEENRELVYRGPLKKSPTDSSEIMVYLFNHALLFARQKVNNRQEELRVYKKPIPLELLIIIQMDEVIPKLGIAKRPSSSLIPGVKAAPNNPKATSGAKEGFPITFRHIGRGGYDLTLYATSHVSRRKWMEAVEAQQTKLRDRGNFYTKTVLCDDYFTSAHKINCMVPIDGGRKLVFGTDTGVYVMDRKPKSAGAKPKRVLDAGAVTQVDVLEEYQLLLVLATKSLLSYPLEVLDAHDNQSPILKRPKKIQNHANFFKAGVCMGRHLVCSAKMSGISTTIKVFEPSDTISKNKKKPAIGRMFQGNQDALKPFKVGLNLQAPSTTISLDATHFRYVATITLTRDLKEFYVPAESTSVDFLRSKLCVACSRGFEVVSLETLETQPLLDHADTSLDFVTRKDVVPISIERLNGEFLLHYNEYSFFVNRNGWRARPDWRIDWEGKPNTFALSHPYLLAFEPNFIEIRHLETSALVHIITAKNIRMLHSSTREVSFLLNVH